MSIEYKNMTIAELLSRVGPPKSAADLVEEELQLCARVAYELAGPFSGLTDEDVCSQLDGIRQKLELETDERERACLQRWEHTLWLALIKIERDN